MASGIIHVPTTSRTNLVNFSLRCSRSHKRAYDLAKIKNQSCKGSHELHVGGIRVGRIRTFSFLQILFMTPSLLIQTEAEAKEPTNHKAWNLEL